MNKAYSNKALPAGTVLREWRLEQVLGVGGFGIVYKGRGIYFDELVAIKEYFPSAISDRREGDTVVPNDSASEEIHALGLKKFVEEAKLLWNLSKPTRHPNIVSVRSLFEIHGTAYMVMDFEDGLSLSQMLKEGKTFTEASLMALIRPIAEGLERAHRVGVLHRDIKPPNILVSEDGRPVLIDFGSARFESGEATSTTVTFHTPPYAAIEQYVKTYQQGPWTDIYALGVVLYECVAGEKPPEVLERLHGGLGKALAEGEWPGYSRSFLRAIDAAMTIRPTDRPQSISQWLAMFDLPDDAPMPVFTENVDDAPTRFATFQTLPEEIIPVAAPVPVPAPETAPEPTPEPTEAAPMAEAPAEETKEGKAAAGKKSSLRVRPAVVAMAAGAAIVIFVGGNYLSSYVTSQIDLMAKVRSMSIVKALQSSKPAEAAPAEAVEETGPASLSAELRAIASSAGQAGAPANAVRKANDAGARIETLAAQLAELAKKPGQQAAMAAREKEMGDLAKSASSELALALTGSIEAKAKKLAADQPWANPARPGAADNETPERRQIAANLRQSKQKLATAAASARNAPDAKQALAFTRQSIQSSQQFNAAYRKAYRATDVAQDVGAAAPAAATTSTSPAPAVVAAGADLSSKSQALNAISSQARDLANKVIALSKKGKPGSSASDSERQGYQMRLNNAARAQEYLAYLDVLANSMRGVKSESEADKLIGRAETVKGYLTTMLSRSMAAMP